MTDYQGLAHTTGELTAPVVFKEARQQNLKQCESTLGTVSHELAKQNFEKTGFSQPRVFGRVVILYQRQDWLRNGQKINANFTEWLQLFVPLRSNEN